MVYIVARSLQGSVSHGILSVLGGFTGAFVHIAAATLGLSALVMQSVIAFSIIKYIGAAYLVYLGVRTLLERTETTAVPLKPLSNTDVFRRGILTDVLNPKTALFFSLPLFLNLSISNRVALLYNLPTA